MDMHTRTPDDADRIVSQIDETRRAEHWRNPDRPNGRAAFFESRGFAVGFLYFPAEQTIYAKEEHLDVDDDTLSYIDKLTDRLSAAGLRTMNTKTCLNKAKLRESVAQMQDTHLNGNGLESLAECLGRSSLASLVIGTPQSTADKKAEH
jgi:hypothetical protein